MNFLKIIRSTIIFVLIIYIVSCPLTAQIQTDVNISIANQNIWRGTYQAGLSIQPEVNFNYKNWNLQVWGTSDFNAEEKEIDLSIGYNLKNFNIGLTDYWFGGMTDAYSKDHILENNVTYTFTRFPLSLECHTVLVGCNSSLPVFQRISYSPEWHGCEYEFSIGYSSWKNDLLESKGFAFNELSAAVNKEIALARNLKLSFSSSLIYNPYADNLFFVCKVEVPLSF